MDMERSMAFTIDNGVAQSADSSLIWPPHHPSGPHDLEDDDEAAEFFNRASDDYGQDDDDRAVVYQFDPESGFLMIEEIVQGDNAFDTMVRLNLLAQQLGVDFETVVEYVFGAAHSGGGAGLLGAAVVVVPASDAAVAGLEKQAFHATATAEECGVTGCAICLEDFEDGEEVTVMPCSRGHEFHQDCITKWLEKSNTCPLCRHALPTDDVMDDDDDDL